MTGHGWVKPLPSGAKARCGGPGMCAVCQIEAGIWGRDNGHLAFIHTRMPGPVKVAVCECGWESHPHVTAIAAIRERHEHMGRELERHRRRAARSTT